MARPEHAAASELGRAPGPARKPRPVSLKAAALRLLSRREYSRYELEQRLKPKAESVQQLQQVLDELAQRKFQSDERFTESLVHRRAAQFGARRIEYELEQHRVARSGASKAGTTAASAAASEAAASALTALAGTERERALALWRRRFNAPPADLNEKAKQYRFLAQRGFESDTIRWVLKQGPDHEPLSDD